MRQTDKLISIIIPIYNMEAFLEETLESVKKLSYPNLEVVMMNDGSTDGSAAIAQKYAEADERFHYYYQENGGISAARNKAISYSTGTYIFPLDSDDIVHDGFLEKATEVLISRPDVKVVCGSDIFFGDREGPWKLPEFDIKLLARKNIIPATALYRRVDYDKTEGYSSAVIWKEDWDFWISMLKTGGNVVRLSIPAISYRIRKSSSRTSFRGRKNDMIEIMNKRHGAFFLEQLDGPLRIERSWSTLFNRVKRIFSGDKMEVAEGFKDVASFIYELPKRFDREGDVIYKGRNELRHFSVEGHELIVKSYQLPIFVNRLIYGLLRPSKAQRSYEYAQRFLAAGIGSPMPVGYFTERRGFLLRRSYFVSLQSTCNYRYTDFKTHQFTHANEILKAIGETTARMHEAGFLHKDYSAGNILFRDELPVPIEIIDLNRMRFHPISMEEGCKNFERLPGDHQMFEQMGAAYARVRNMDEKKCISLIERTHE